jgi:hypothetical protein
MENQNKQQPSKNFRTQHYGAHSNCHAGLSDYNDGGYHDKYTTESQDNEEFDGTEAAGNDSKIDEDDYGKYHSGL